MTSSELPHAQSMAFEATPVETYPKKPSMIYNVLPAVVQNRIPALPSIRGSFGGIRGRLPQTKSPATISEDTTPVTPPPSYTERPRSAFSDRSSISTSDGENSLRDDISEGLPSSASTPPIFLLSETQTGINWKYASQGITLVSQAYQESHSLLRKNDETSTILTRQLYIHGMTYLLRGLPTDLTPEEALGVRAALSQNLSPAQTDSNFQALVKLDQDSSVNRGSSEDTSLLHRAVAVVVFQTFVLIQFLMPYIKLFVAAAYRFERKHNITQKLLNNSITTADMLRRRSLQLSHTICQMNDGKVGQAVNDLTLWWIRGVTGGLQQGITDGVTMLSNERPASAAGRVEKMD